jgi:hypothetical protein
MRRAQPDDWTGNAAHGEDAPTLVAGVRDLRLERELCNKAHLTPEEARRNSPIAQSYPGSASLLLVVARDESDEYHRQSKAMLTLWRQLGLPVEMVIPVHLDHFNVVNQLRRPDCELVRLQLGRMLSA